MKTYKDVYLSIIGKRIQTDILGEANDKFELLEDLALAIVAAHIESEGESVEVANAYIKGMIDSLLNDYEDRLTKIMRNHNEKTNADNRFSSSTWNSHRRSKDNGEKGKQD